MGKDNKTNNAKVSATKDQLGENVPNTNENLKGNFDGKCCGKGKK